MSADVSVPRAALGPAQFACERARPRARSRARPAGASAPTGLHHEIGRPGAHRGDDVVDAAVGGLHDHRERRSALAHSRQDGEAVEIGHDKIENHQSTRRPRTPNRRAAPRRRLSTVGPVAETRTIASSSRRCTGSSSTIRTTSRMTGPSAQRAVPIWCTLRRLALMGLNRAVAGRDATRAVDRRPCMHRLNMRPCFAARLPDFPQMMPPMAKPRPPASLDDPLRRTRRLPEWNLADLYAGVEAPSAQARPREGRCRVRAPSSRTSRAGSPSSPTGEAGAARRGGEALRGDRGPARPRLISYASLLYAGDTTDPARAKFYGDVQERITDASLHLLFFTLELNRIDDAHARKRDARSGARPLPAVDRGCAQGKALSARGPRRAAVPREVA